jgi:hypothetical protein
MPWGVTTATTFTGFFADAFFLETLLAGIYTIFISQCKV